MSRHALPESLPEVIDHSRLPEVDHSRQEGYGQPRGTFSKFHESPQEVTPDSDLYNAKLGKRSGREGHLVPFGLSSVSFACIVALLTTIIVSAAVGGGVGSSLAHEQNKVKALEAVTSSLAHPATAQPSASTTSISSITSASTTASPTSGVQNYVPLDPSQITTLALNCPAINDQQYSSIWGQTYILQCGVSLDNYDLAAIVAYNFGDCIEACSSMNEFSGNATLCTAVVFTADINAAFPNEHANCWLKFLENITGTKQYSMSARITNNGSGLG